MTPHEAFIRQGRACSALGSPFMGQLMSALAPRIARGGPVYDRINGWDGDITPSGDSVPLRVAAGLHRLVLGGHAPTLTSFYPPYASGDEALAVAVEEAFEAHTDFFDRWLDNPPQTNEVRRSAVLIAAAHWLMARHQRPMRLSELGASAGLNLGFDQYVLQTVSESLGPPDAPLTLSPDWDGKFPAPADIVVADRRGVDLNPVDLGSEDDRLRLLSYLWPDQPDRLRNTEVAIDIALRLGTTVDADDAASWLEARLETAVPGVLHLVYHTIAWQYFPEETAERCRTAIEVAGQKATADAPLAWFGMEADTVRDGAGLTLRLWPGDHVIDCGRADFHGRWVRWTAPGT